VVNRGTGMVAVKICEGWRRDLMYCVDELDNTLVIKEITLCFNSAPWPSLTCYRILFPTNFALALAQACWSLFPYRRAQCSISGHHIRQIWSSLILNKLFPQHFLFLCQSYPTNSPYR